MEGDWKGKEVIGKKGKGETWQGGDACEKRMHIENERMGVREKGNKNIMGSNEKEERKY